MRFIRGDVFAVPLPAHAYRLVYADPPYANCRFKYARGNRSRQWGRDARGDFLRELIARMEFFRSEDGVCALSLASTELRLMALFPSRARVLAWCKPYAAMRPGVWPTFAWEPLVAWGRFPTREEQRSAAQTPHDWIALSPAVPKGAHETPKPSGFAEWVLAETLGPRSGPVLELFAGTCPLALAGEARGMESTAVDIDDYAPILAEREA